MNCQLRRSTTSLSKGLILRLLLALMGLAGFSSLASADRLIAQRFVSSQPDAELESVLYLTAGVALADLGFSSTRAAAQAGYVLSVEYSVSEGKAEVSLSLATAKDEATRIATLKAKLPLDLSLDAEYTGALRQLLAVAALDSPAAGEADTSIGGLFSSELITRADTMRTKKTRRLEALAYGGGMYFVGDFADYGRFGAGASLDLGFLLIQPSWSLSLGPRTTVTRVFLNDGVAGGGLYLTTLGLNLQFGVGAAQAQRLSACLSGGGALITVAGDSGPMTKTVPYADAGIQAGFPLGKDFFLGGDLRFAAIFEGSVLIMAVAPTISLCKEF